MKFTRKSGVFKWIPHLKELDEWLSYYTFKGKSKKIKTEELLRIEKVRVALKRLTKEHSNKELRQFLKENYEPEKGWFRCKI